MPKLLIEDSMFLALGSKEHANEVIRQWLAKRGFDLKKPISRTYNYEKRGMLYTQEKGLKNEINRGFKKG